jgi:hypothetical protein
MFTPQLPATGWRVSIKPASGDSLYVETQFTPVRRLLGATWGTFGNGIQAGVRTWLAVLAAIALAAAAWIRLPRIPRRFSLRALLVVTTLVAVVLGLIMWAAR